MQATDLRRTIITLSDAATGSQPAAAPDWIKVFPAGEVRIADAPSCWTTDEGAALILAAFAAHDADMVLDYEHQTLSGDQAPAAGWIKELAWRPDDGLYARVDWTAKGADYVAKREYRYISPVFFARASDQVVVELVNIGLTNQPRMVNVAPLVNKMQLMTEDRDMPDWLRKALGLAESATEDEAQSALEKVQAEALGYHELKKRPAIPVSVAEELGLKEGQGEVEALLRLKALKAPVQGAQALAVTVETLRQELHALKSGSLVEQALREGKTSPAEVEAWAGKLAADHPDMFGQIVLSRAVGSVVPVGQVQVSPETPAHLKADDGLQLSINKMLGVSDDAWAKYGPRKEV